MGVTALSDSNHKNISSGVSHKSDRRLLLVFERATEGSLLDYLDKVLPGLSFMQAWEKITGIVLSVATGINSLHKRNIIHR